MQNNLFRQGLAVGIIVLFLGASIVIPSTGKNVSKKFTDAIFEINILDKETFELTIKPPAFEFNSIHKKNREFTTLTLPREGSTYAIGEAKLPVIRRMIEIPYGANPEIVVTSVSWETTSLEERGLPEQILPVQPSIPKIPGASEEAEFIVNADYYATNNFMPNDVVRIVEIGEIRGHRVMLVEVFPVKYNPSLGELHLMTACDIRVNLPGSDIAFTSEKIKRYSSPAFNKMLGALLANYGCFEDAESKFQNNQEGYLIIVYDSFYDEILPLADWKQSIGYNITVTRTSEIPGSLTTENITAYIENAYNNWSIPPSYVLLVGDTVQIPTFKGQDTQSAADLYYVTITPSDYFPDIFIGRFPASEESHVTAMVDKTLTYEQADFPSTNFIKKAAFMASEDRYWVSEGTHDYVIDTYLGPNNYACDKLYCHTYHATTSQVRNALNDGRSLAVFSGHGHTTYWDDGPYFSQSHVNSLNNQDMYPFVCSHACLTGRFTVSECFGETWLRAPNKAGLAFWGSSTYTYWDEDEILEEKTFSAWWDDNIESIGGMTDMGLYYTYQYYGGGGRSRYYFEAYNILGDPSVKIWRDDPQLICGDVNNDDILNLGDVVYLINYLYKGGPEPKLELCIGDCNNDTLVGISDVLYLIDYLYRGGPKPEGCCDS